MIQSLLIKNYALIQHLEMSPSDKLNIITGETGAGKSIMLGAVGLLLGNRADKKVLFNTEEKCVVEATFDLSDYQLNSLFEELNSQGTTILTVTHANISNKTFDQVIEIEDGILREVSNQAVI